MNKLSYEELQQGCEKEQLHLSGKIQPFGALICVDKKSGKFAYASANTDDFLGISPEEILSNRIESSTFEIDRLIARLPNRVGASAYFESAVSTRLGQKDLYLYFNGTHIVAEIENASILTEKESIVEWQKKLLQPPVSMVEFDKQKQYFVDAIRGIIGFDRVMVYKFMNDWSGEVVAESVRDGFGSYFGLRFPASDIPMIARNLYLLNTSRLIPDVYANSVDVLSAQSGILLPPLDLTYSNLRSVSPVHIEYLTNMGVKASFSIAIKISGGLWGLIACHNETPKYISAANRNSCAALVQIFSRNITSFKASSLLRIQREIEQKISDSFGEPMRSPIILDDLSDKLDILVNSIDCCGFMAVSDDKKISAGEIPDDDLFLSIDRYFKNMSGDIVYAVDNLSAIFEMDAAQTKKASGVLSIQIKKDEATSIGLYWFRPEESMQIAWAGNPSKPLQENPEATALAPRKSFEKWVETRRGYSKQWSSEEKSVVIKIKNSLTAKL